MIRHLHLPNGLAVTLVHQPEARDAAALVQVAAGSHDESESTPGLAHLLEHMLFTGSQRWPDEGRLMSWIQANGGRVNATTLARRSAYFFSIAAQRFEDGLARLQDLLCTPLLEQASIRQEVAVIDAEYRLLQQHAPAQAEAALFSRVTEPDAFHRFQIGSAQAFGHDLNALHRALRKFHQRFYVAENMRLWLQGPQPLDELQQFAQIFAARLPQGEARSFPSAPRLLVDNAVQLCCAGNATYWHSWLINGDFCDSVTLMREFLLDEAPSSLMGTLRQRGLASNLEFKWLYQSDKVCWLAAVFTTEQPEAVCEQLQQAIQALLQTSSKQQQHYRQLATQRFNALSPLEQLRQRALGFAPAEPQPFHTFLSMLKTTSSARLFCSSTVKGEKLATQGFDLRLAPWLAPQENNAELTAFRLYPMETAFSPSALPENAIPLLHLDPGKSPATLILRPEFFCNLPAEVARACGKRLRPLFATLRHLGGSGEWDEVQGVWQLTLRLPEDVTIVDWALEQILHQLADKDKQTVAELPESIAIRQLLTLLPAQLTGAVMPTGWRAILSGGSEGLHQAIARRLTAFSQPVNAPQPVMRLSSRSGVTRIFHPSSDSALLLFIPLDDQQQLAALKALALVYEPRFFQRLRVEQQIGYVVSSRYLRCADHDGILFGLQSPHLSAGSLLGHCKTFLRLLGSEIASLECESLRLRLRIDAEHSLLTALRKQNGLTDLSQASIDALSLSALQQLHSRLTKNRRRWRVLFSDGCQP